MDLGNTGMEPRTEILLFSASRAQIVHQVIRPRLEAGGVVVCDRFYDSTLAYQGYGHGLDLTALRAITDFATGGLRPDLTFLIDLPAEDGLRRRRRGGQWNRLPPACAPGLLRSGRRRARPLGDRRRHPACGGGPVGDTRRRRGAARAGIETHDVSRGAAP
jgi:hypothetical protein